MATLAYLCLLILLTASVHSSSIEEKQAVLGATNVDLYQQLLGRVENLERRDQDQQAEIETLRSELNAEKQRTSILEEVIASLKSTDSATSDDDEMTESDTKLAHEREPSKEQKRHEALKTSDQHSPRIVRRQAEVPVVAFHATLKTHQQHTGLHQSVAFDNVITNIGGAYNPHVGLFVAPVPGVYVFYTKILGRSNTELHLSIVRNGVMVANLYVRDAETFYGQDSAMVVLHLAKGDDVDVQINDSDKLIHGSHFSMFSGFLLQEDVQTESIVG